MTKTMQKAEKYSSMTKAQLIETARGMSVSVSSKDKKADIISKINTANSKPQKVGRSFPGEY